MILENKTIKRLIVVLILLVIVLSFIRCSGEQSPLVPFDVNNQITPVNNPFKELPIDKPYSEHVLKGESFTIDVIEERFQRNVPPFGIIDCDVVIDVESINFNKTLSTVTIAINVHNSNCPIIYSVHFVLDEMIPIKSEPMNIDGTTLDDKPFWTFGIIPAGKTSLTRDLQIQFPDRVDAYVTGHIEFSKRAHTQFNDSIMHGEGFNSDNIINSPVYGRIVSNEVMAGVPEGDSISDVYDYLKAKNLIPVGCIWNSDFKVLQLRILHKLSPSNVINDLKADAYLTHPEPNPIISIARLSFSLDDGACNFANNLLDNPDKIGKILFDGLMFGSYERGEPTVLASFSD